MSKEKKFKPSITFYHVLAISLVILALIIYPMKQYAKNNSLEEVEYPEETTIRGLFGRILDFKEDVENVCSKADKDLREYYETADLSKIKLEKKNKKNEKPSKKTKALVDIVAQEGKMEDHAKTYLLSMIPILAFFLFAIFAIPGWIICCGCCCCNCCCCCCCKKPCCRFPFFIVTMACNGIIIISCIYGLAQSNNVFVGIANTECALLKFIGEIQDGETNQIPPRWGGFGEIDNAFDDIKETVDDLDVHTADELQSHEEEVNNKKQIFENFLETDAGSVCKFIQGKRNDNTNSFFTKDGNNYWLTIYEKFGTCTEDDNMGTIYKSLRAEYSIAASQSEEIFSGSVGGFGDLTGGDIDIGSTLEEAKGPIGDINDTINDIKESVSGAIVDNYEKIDSIGKKGFKAVFSVLTILDAAIVALIIIYFLFGTTLCFNCKCLRCLNKFFIHILWNILALLMIITFLLGALFALVGKIGSDLVSVVSYLIGEENLSLGEDAKLIHGASKYLDVCFNGNGSLSSVLDFSGANSGTEQIQQLNGYSKQISDLKVQFQSLRESIFIRSYSQDIDNAIAYKKENIGFCIKGNILTDGHEYKLYDLVAQLNAADEDHPSHNYWNLQCTDTTGATCKNPKDGIDNPSSDNPTYTDRKNDIEKIIAEITALNTGTTNLRGLITSLDEKYKTFIDTELSVLDTFNDQIKSLTGVLEKYIGNDGDAFAFLNCTFIGTDKDILLKYLDEALGSNIYKVGIFLLLAACGMVFSIIFTILEVIIINTAIDEKIKEMNEKEAEIRSEIGAEVDRINAYKAYKA